MPDPRPRILITGSRSWNSAPIIRAVLERMRRIYPSALLVHGGAKGADEIAGAVWRSWGLPVEVHPADWERYGRGAGPVRNAAMVQRGADVCLAFLDGPTPGATGCALLAEKAGIETMRFSQEVEDDDAADTAA